MKSTFNYIKYIIEHKINVFTEGRKLGLGIWQLLMHDMSKLTLSEFFQYRDKFFSDKGGFFIVNKRFDEAWLNHVHKNKHHWNYWLLVIDNVVTPFVMPLKYEIEMIADWQAMTRKFKKLTDANEIREETFKWYSEQTDIILHDSTRKSILFYFDHGIFSKMNEHLLQ